MSAPACLFFFGVRFEVEPAELPLLEAKTHPMMSRARDVGLGHAWRDVGGARYLFVGRKLAEIGVEGDLGARYTADELRAEAEAVAAKLKEADIPGEPTFWLRWLP